MLPVHCVIGPIWRGRGGSCRCSKTSCNVICHPVAGERVLEAPPGNAGRPGPRGTSRVSGACAGVTLAQGETQGSLTDVLKATSGSGRRKGVSEGQADLAPSATPVQGTTALSARKHGTRVAVVLSTCWRPSPAGGRPGVTPEGACVFLENAGSLAAEPPPGLVPPVG